MTSKMLVAEVHNQSQWFIEQLQVRKQLHSESLKITSFDRLGFDNQAIVDKKIAPKLFFECGAHIGDCHCLLPLNLVACNLQRLLKALT